MKFDDLKDLQLQARLKGAKTPEELLTVAQECGVELSEAQLEGVAGGAWCDDYCTDFAYCKNDGPL